MKHAMLGWCIARQCGGTETAKPCPGRTDRTICTCRCHQYATADQDEVDRITDEIIDRRKPLFDRLANEWERELEEIL